MSWSKSQIWGVRILILDMTEIMDMRQPKSIKKVCRVQYRGVPLYHNTMTIRERWVKIFESWPTMTR